MKKRTCIWRATLMVLMLIPLGLASAAERDEIPGADQVEPIALVGGTVHTVSGDTFSPGILVFEQGKITAVGTEVEIPEGARVIDVTGQHVYPSLFESHSQVGISEIGSAGETQDYAETGSFNPNVRTHVAVNPDSDVIPVTRSNGVLLALSAPEGGVISGKSAVLQLDGWSFEDLTIDAETALHLNWPRMTPRRSFRSPQSPAEQSRQRDQQLQQINDFFDAALEYRQARQARPDLHPIDSKLEAMLPVLAGETPLFVSANDLAQIQSAVAFANEYGLKIIIFGGFDAPLCAPLLRQHNVPVIVSAVYRRPLRADESYDASYTLPNRLLEAGIQFAISGSDRASTWNTRNLAYNAGTAVAYGLPMEEGIKAITLYPAQIFGVDDQVGSLDVGKDATLFVADGNPMETFTEVSMAFVQGRQVSLSDKHKRLYEKYSEKYRRLQEDDGSGQ